MKSGLISARDPYLMDPSLVDPNLILDYGSSFKDDYLCNTVDPYLDLINCNDAQLENIILSSGLCGENVNPWAENEFEDLLKDIKISPMNQVAVPCELKTVVAEELRPSISNETDIANYEEVYSSDESVNSETTQENISFHLTKPEAPTRKRKLGDSPRSSAPKRRKPRRNTRRIQDERVKNQNKVAAMKYRLKKKDEKETLDDLLQIEVDKNTKLKGSVEELKVNIDVLKELLGKYLSPSQIDTKTKSH